MRSTKVWFGAGIAALAAILALVIAFGVTGSDTASAGGTKDLSGVFDVQVTGFIVTNNEDGTDKSPSDGNCTDGSDNDGDTLADQADPQCQDDTEDAFHCISRQDHTPSDDGLPDPVTVQAQCYSNLDLGIPGAEPPDQPGEGPSGDNGGVGPPPPPPYSTAEPTHLSGTYDSSTDTIVVVGCFDNVGGLIGPNVVSRATIPHAAEQHNAGTVSRGFTEIWFNRTQTECTTAEGGTAPAVAPTAKSPLKNTRVSDTRDLDGDGCTDADELATAKDATIKCGDDPYNPHDYVSGSLSGNYTFFTTAVEANYDPATNEYIAGAYFHCIGVVTHVSNTDIPTRLYCYVDAEVSEVNPEHSTATGDGIPGSPPPSAPDIFGDIDDTHTQLSGSLDKTTNILTSYGCFQDEDGQGVLGNVWVQATLDAHTGHGTVEIYVGLDEATCKNSTPSSKPPGDSLLYPAALVDSVRQDPTSERDSDGDGCPDNDELSDTPSAGGLRDPFNRFDYFNPTADGQNRVDDILAVVAQFGIDDPDPNYDPGTDRTSLTGGNDWNLAEGNGQQRVDDILASVKQFGHDCA